MTSAARGQPERRAYTVKSACQVYDIGKTTIYELLKSGRLKRRKVGRRTLIMAKDIERLIEGKAR